MHKPILLQDLGLSFSHKTCFENFNTRILPGSRIAIIGRNGSGKSSLLNILQNKVTSTEGTIIISNEVQIAYVPQHIDGEASGGERFNQALSEALSVFPDVLLLDEPTNHLDKKNRQVLLRLLHDFEGTLIVVSHDVELLRKSVDIFWHIEQKHIHIFQGHYDDYVRECAQQRFSLEEQKNCLNRQKKEMHQRLMQEQQRAAKSKEKGEKNITNRKWATVGSKTKMGRANTTSVNKKSALRDQKHDLTDLINTESVLDAVQKLVPTWSMLELRRHLTDFLFFNNEEVNTVASSLSGGERA